MIARKPPLDDGELDARHSSDIETHRLRLGAGIVIAMCIASALAWRHVVYGDLPLHWDSLGRPDVSVNSLSLLIVLPAIAAITVALSYAAGQLLTGDSAEQTRSIRARLSVGAPAVLAVGHLLVVAFAVGLLQRGGTSALGLPTIGFVLLGVAIAVASGTLAALALVLALGLWRSLSR